MRRCVCDRCGQNMDEPNVWRGVELHGPVHQPPSTAQHASMLGRYVVAIAWAQFRRVGGEVFQVDLCRDCIRVIVGDLIG